MRTTCTSIFANLRVNWVGNPDKGGINFTGTFVDAESSKSTIKFRVWNENMAVFNTANVHSGKLVDVIAELRSTGEYVVRHIAPAANAGGQANPAAATATHAAQKVASAEPAKPEMTPEEKKMQQFKSVANDVFAHGLANL